MILVDDYRCLWRGMLMSHLVSDSSVQELHEFATLLGLKTSWFQQRNSFPHYDVSDSIRRKAIRLGAKPVSPFELIRRAKRC